MTTKEAKEVIKKLLVEVVDNGSATVKLGTEQSKALIALVKGS